MGAREEKLLMARASFENEGSLKYFSENKEKEEGQWRGKSSFIIRFVVALLLFGVFVYGDCSDVSKINEISQKSYDEIQKSEINVEKCSALFGRMW